MQHKAREQAHEHEHEHHHDNYVVSTYTTTTVPVDEKVAPGTVTAVYNAPPGAYGTGGYGAMPQQMLPTPGMEGQYVTQQPQMFQQPVMYAQPPADGTQ